MGNFGQPDFGVAHGCSVVAVDRAKVALSVYQHVPHGKILRHAHNRVVDRLIAMRMVFADHVAHDTGRFFVGAVPVVAKLVHRKQNPPVHRFETVSGVGQGAADNHAHGVIEVAAPHFLF